MESIVDINPTALLSEITIESHLKDNFKSHTKDLSNQETDSQTLLDNESKLTEITESLI